MDTRVLLDAGNFPGTVVAASEQWVAMIRYTSGFGVYSITGDSAIGPIVADGGLAYRDLAHPGSPWRAANLGRANALIDDRHGKLLEPGGRLSQLDIATNVGTTLTDPRQGCEPKEWALAGDLLFCLDGTDLVAYDLREHSLAAVLPGFVAERINVEPPSGYCADCAYAGDANQYRKLEADRDHLFAVVDTDGRSRVLSLSAFASHAALGTRLFKATDSLLMR